MRHSTFWSGVGVSSAILFGLFALTATAGTMTFTAPCAPGQSVCDIQDATVGPGVTISTLTINAPGLFLPLSGDNLTITLLGLQHPELGDLTATLSHAITSADLFSRAGAVAPLDPNDPGFLADFGGNYSFGSFGSDLWATAAPLADTDILPEGAYIAGTTNDTPSGLSSAFNGQPISGTWTLTIQDLVPGPDPFPNPQFTGWELTVSVAPVPEPSYTAIFGVLGLALCVGRAARATWRPATKA
jgi:hypothetical protein